MRSLSPIRVLIVDDDRVDRTVCQACLRESPIWQFEFAEAESVAGGVEIASSWRPDCILLDFVLPDGDGIEVLDRLPVSERSCSIILLTAYGGEELAVRAMKAGATDYLPKARLSPDILPRAVVNSVESFRMKQQTENQRAALAVSQRRYRELLEAIPQMVWTANGAGRIEYVNTRWIDYTGLDAAQAAGLNWDSVVDPQDRARTADAWHEAAGSGSVLEVEHRLRRASDGAYRWHLVRAVPLRGPNGEIINWLGTCTEIDEQKREGNIILQEQKIKGIGTLAGGVAHDFNNLLVCILGGAACAMESLPQSHPAQEMLSEVVRAGERLAELTRRMLAYAGKGIFRVEPTDVARVVHQACDCIRETIPDSVRIEIRNTFQLPPVTLDADQLRQAVVDLIKNAAEAIGSNPSGRVTLQTSVIDLDDQVVHRTGFAPDAAAGRYVSIEVRDNGCGMDEETRNRIFDPFFSTKFVGRGLSLSAVLGFVRGIGGGIQVETILGKGTSFHLLLPTRIPYPARQWEAMASDRMS